MLVRSNEGSEIVPMRFQSSSRLAALAVAATAAVATAGSGAATASAAPPPPTLAQPIHDVVVNNPCIACLLPDADSDGVPDSKDKCPGTAAGAVVDSKGCSVAQNANQPIGTIGGSHLCVILNNCADAATDGVADSKDPCPGPPAGTAVDAKGCSAAQNAANQPPADADNDGVPDSKDTCPGTAAGAGVDSKGCSAAQNSANHPSTPPSPDVDVHVTVPNNPPAVLPSTSAPVIVNAPAPSGDASTASSQPVIITTPGPAPQVPAGPPVVNVSVPSQTQAPAQRTVHHTTRHRVRHHRR